MSDDIASAIALAFWGTMPKCDLQGLNQGPCGLAHECSCWPIAVAHARAFLAALDLRGTPRKDLTS